MIGVPRDVNGTRIIDELTKMNIDLTYEYETIQVKDYFGIESHIIKLKYKSEEPVLKMLSQPTLKFN